MKTILNIIICILLLVSISMVYFAYYYNALALWITIAVGLIAILSFLIVKKKDEKVVSNTNRSVPYRTPKALLILLIGYVMIACSPSHSQELQIIRNYKNIHSLYICKLDSSSIEIQVMAKDKYQAMKYFDEKLQESDITRGYKVTEFPIDLLP